MKIKDIKGIAEKLPKLKNQFLTTNKVIRQMAWCDGRVSMHKEIMDTNLNIEDIVEVDVEKVKQIILDSVLRQYAWCHKDYKGKEEVADLVNAIAKSNCLKFKEK